MDFFNFFKGFLGIPPRNNQTFLDEREDQSQQLPRDRYLNEDYPRDSFGFDRDSAHNDEIYFNVFSNPVEMHRYFEHQMNEMLKSFSAFGFGDNMFENPSGTQLPSIKDHMSKEGNLRDQYLKPGFQHAAENDKKDNDIDGQMNFEDLEQNLRGPSTSQIIPHAEHSKPHIKVFGQSISSRIIHRPDGTQEIHKTTVDQEGNETKTVTKQQGDKKYTITTKTDKYGHKEVTENLVNIDDNDVRKFTSLEDSRNETSELNLFPFDKFFK